MKRGLKYLFIILFISCTTVTNETTEELSNKVVEPESSKIEKEEEGLIEEETTQDYDLTILKSGSYPIIKNDTPFTEEEIIILKNKDGLEIEASIEMAHYFKYFLRDKRKLLNSWLDNARPNIPIIREQFLEAGLPEELIYLPFLESGYNVKAYSRVGAGGIWQFMPKTAKSYGLTIDWWTDERRSPTLATPFAIKHLVYLEKLFDNWYTALAAYNAGEGRMARAMKKVEIYDYFELIKTDALPRETRRYVVQYMAIVKIMKNLEALGFEPIDWDLECKLTTVKIPGGMDLFGLAQSINMTWGDFTKQNPEFRRKINNPGKSSTVIIPKDKVSLAQNYIKNIKPLISNNSYSHYTIKRGDSWWYLSQMTNHTISSLKRLNNFNNNNLYIGQNILLPGSAIKPKPVNVSYNTSTSNLQTHRVRNGETAFTVSLKYNIKLSSFLRENNLTSHSVLKVGQILRLPGYPILKENVSTTNTQKRTYTVKSGDSVWLIAQSNNIPYKTLLALNNLNKTSKLRIGEKLLLY